MSSGGPDFKETPFDIIVETYEGVNIYNNVDLAHYYFTYKGKFYTNYISQFTAKQAIDILLVEAIVPDDWAAPAGYLYGIERYYRGVPIYHAEYGFMGGGTGYYEVFWFKGVAYDNSPFRSPIPDLEDEIDKILGGSAAPEPSPEPPPIPGPPIIPPEPTPETPISAPVDLGWLQGIADWFGNLAKWFGDTFIAPILGAINGIGPSINGLGDKVSTPLNMLGGIKGGLDLLGPSIAQGITDQTSQVVQNAIQEALTNVITVLPGAVGNSPAWKDQIKATLDPYANEIVNAVLSETDPSKYAKSPISPVEAKDALNKIAGGIIAVEIALFIAHAALEGATLGQVEALKELETLVMSKLGLNQVASAAVTIPLDELVMKKARQYYAREYTPEIPSYQDLINMRVKEKISQEDFTENLAYQGFGKNWADLIWDAHFQAPGLNDILTAWRRGEITEARVDELMILVDLDPFYKRVFDTRKYVDPSLSLARFMFETGSINEAQVREIVHRNGFRPDDTDRLVDYVIHFQERRYRQRYITALATGYARGVVEKAELGKSVIDAGYTQGTADWIVKSADIRKDIAARGTTTGGPKLLAIGDLKKAYANDIVNEDALRTELQLRGYDTVDIETMIEVIDLEKAEVVEGKKVVALSVSEMINAFRYGVWSEDQLRTALMVRGLALDEVNTLIETKKRSWGVASQQGAG